MICPGHATGILTEEERCSRWALFLPSAIFHAAGCKCGSMHKSGVQFAECLSAWPGPRVEELGGCRLAPCADRGLLEWWQMWSSLPFWSIWSSLRGLCSGATESQPQPEVVGRSPPIPGTAAGSDKKSSKQASRMDGGKLLAWNLTKLLWVCAPDPQGPLAQDLLGRKGLQWPSTKS